MSCPPTCRAAPTAPHCSARVAALGVATDILINNAGLRRRAPVAKSIPEQQLNLIEVDVAAVVDLCSRFLPGMVERGRGAVLNVSSLAGFYPLPGNAAYGAAKAFVLSYTESLRIELGGHRGRGKRVVSRTGQHRIRRAGRIRPRRTCRHIAEFMWKSADQVARAAIDGLDAGKCRIVPGRMNRLVAACCRFAPHERLLPPARAAGRQRSSNNATANIRKHTDYWTLQGSGIAGR